MSNLDVERNMPIAPASGAAGPPAVPGRHFTLFLLTLIAGCSVMDRSVITITLEAIRHEFNLSDAKLGLMSGLAFSICYGLASAPFGMLADRVSRRNLVAGCLVFWSAMTAVCGSATSFGVLVLGRMGIGVGEAGGAPASISMVADLYPPRRRATVVAIYYASTPLGGMVALGLGGLILQAAGWRAVFLAGAIPGLILAPVLWALTKEPPRAAQSSPGARAGSLRDAFRSIGSQASLLHVIVAITLMSFASQGVASWAAAFFIRYHRLSAAKIGPILGLSIGTFGLLGNLFSGAIGDFLGQRDPRLRAWFLAGACVLIVPVLLTALLVPSDALAVGAYVAEIFCVFLFSAASIAISLSVTEPRLRGTISSLQFLATNVIGIGLGPMGIGLLSDALSHRFGDQSLRWSMAIIGLLYLWAGLHYALCARTLRSDLQKIKEGAPEPAPAGG